MAITNGQQGTAADFINNADRNATPSNDAGKVPKLEVDGRLGGFFTRNGTTLNYGETINGATLPVPVYQDKTDNELYACDGNDTNKLKFIGFAVSNGTNGNPGLLQASGIVSGFTGLQEGQKYYLQDAVGTIGTSIGTYEVLVGVAVSETELLIQKGRRYNSGTFTIGSATTTVTLNVGFRPSRIRLNAGWINAATTPQHSVVQLCWDNGTLKAISRTVASSSNEKMEATAKVYASTNWDTIFMTFTIENVTDTSFDIVYTETNNYSEGGLVLWEAEGEL